MSLDLLHKHFVKNILEKNRTSKILMLNDNELSLIKNVESYAMGLIKLS